MVKAGTSADRAFRCYACLKSPRVPRGVTVMNPYTGARIQSYVHTFLEKYFSDNRERTLILGINPGRFGAETTGVTFSDPVALADECAIPYDMARRREGSRSKERGHRSPPLTDVLHCPQGHAIRGAITHYGVCCTARCAHTAIAEHCILIRQLCREGGTKKGASNDEA
jgi:hypothetical protein